MDTGSGDEGTDGTLLSSRQSVVRDPTIMYISPEMQEGLRQNMSTHMQKLPLYQFVKSELLYIAQRHTVTDSRHR